MKRILAFCMIIGLVFAFGLTASAATATLTATAANPQPGTEITVNFGVKANSNLACGGFTVTYDTDTFEYVDYQAGELLNSYMSAGNLVNGQFLIQFAGTSNITAEGTLFSVTFKVDSDATGAHTFYINPDQNACADEQVQSVEVTAASVTVTPTGTPVTGTDVTPVTSVDSTGNSYVVGASSVPTPAQQKKANLLGWIIGIAAVLGVLAVAILIVWVIFRSNKKAVTKEGPVHRSILDDEGKQMLDLTDDQLDE